MLVKTSEQFKLKLSNFEGPLAFLIHLVQKEELEATTLHILQILEQYRERQLHQREQDVDEGAEFIGSAATLLWLKSKTLLPQEEQTPEVLIEEYEDAPHVSIEELIDYCRFKQAAKGLSFLEEMSQGLYVRGKDVATEDLRKPLGIEHISLTEIATLFNSLLQKASSHSGLIKEEIWRVADKIQYLRSLLSLEPQIEFGLIFNPESCREELVVTFLAVLELMKVGDLKVGKEIKTGKIVIYA